MTEGLPYLNQCNIYFNDTLLYTLYKVTIIKKTRKSASGILVYRSKVNICFIRDNI